MVDISTFQTQQAAATSKGAATGKAAQTGTGIFSGTQGMSFMDLIFARVTADNANGNGSHLQINAVKDAKQPAASPDYRGHGEPLTMDQLLQALKDSGLTLEDLALAEDAVSDNGEVVVSAPTGEIINADAGVTARKDDLLSSKKLTAFLENLVAGLPQENKPVVLELTPGLIRQAFGKLQFNAGEDNAAPALIATGLTPEKLNEILQDLTDGNDQGEAIMIGMVKILPSEARKEAIFLPRGVVVSQPQSPAGDVNTPQTAHSDLAAKLNALTTGEAGEGEGLLEESKFDEVLRVLQEAQSKGKKTGQAIGDGKGIENAIKQIERHVSAGLSTVPGTPPVLTEVFTNFAMDGVFPEGMDFSYSAQPGQSMPITGTAQLASLVSHAQQAGQPHPATQMVATAIAKATTNGESKNISIRLDPPELGRVSIRMEFHKDNTVKAVLMAEKPETHMMLQRDAHVLERALQDAGLDVDSGSLSFELSQDGNLFQYDQQSGSGGSGGSDGAADNADEAGTEIAIETTMDWYADPETGVMRYSTLV